MPVPHSPSCRSWAPLTALLLAWGLVCHQALLGSFEWLVLKVLQHFLWAPGSPFPRNQPTPSQQTLTVYASRPLFYVAMESCSRTFMSNNLALVLGAGS